MANSRFAENPIAVSGWKKREQNAKDRREANRVAPDVRQARAALLEKREAAMVAGVEAERQKAARPVEVWRELCLIAPDSLLEEAQSYVPNLPSRQMADVIAETLGDRRRARRAADLAASSQAPGKPAKAA